jgi:CheY-like chemotaxis protein
VALRDEFAVLVADAYEHLYDLVYLRSHPLTGELVRTASLTAKERARALHELLCTLVDELDPGPAVPLFSPEWRRHRYMVLRYLRGLSHQEVAEQFQVGLRQYYRVRKSIVDEIADILWRRRVTHETEASEPASEAESTPDRLALLRLEGARLAQAGRYAQVETVAEGVVALLQEVLRERKLEVDLQVPASLPAVLAQQGLLRQALLGVVGYLVERAERASIRWTAQFEGSTVYLSITVVPPEAVRCATPCGGELRGQVPSQGSDRNGERLAELTEMAALSGCHILPVCHQDLVDQPSYITGFEVHIPVARRTVLVIDDNRDVLELFRGYLGVHGYRVATAQTAQDALDKARRLLPYAITLDLMMPEDDGWEVLQSLLADPDTCDIPVVVCTVLKQRELALMLGASGYLEKPITERGLLAALDALE